MATYGYIRTSRDQEPERPGMNPETQRRDLIEVGVPERNIHDTNALMPFHRIRRRERGRTVMTGRTPKRTSSNPAAPPWTAPALLITLLLLTAALAACGGGDDPTPRPTRPASQPEATDPRATTVPTSGQTARPGATQDAEPEATAATGSPMPKLGGGRDGDGVRVKGEFASVSAGYWHTCGVRTDGAVACWGNDSFGQATPPAGEFASVSAEDWHTCGVMRDGTVACWGSNSDLQDNEVSQATPPAGQFSSVNAGSFHICGVRTDGSVACWGEQARGITAPDG